MLERKCICGLSKNGKYTNIFCHSFHMMVWLTVSANWLMSMHPSWFRTTSPIVRISVSEEWPHHIQFFVGETAPCTPYIDASGRILSAIGIDEHFLGHVYWFKPVDIVSIYSLFYHHLISYVVSIPHVSCLHDFHLREFYLRWLPFLRE